MSATATTTSAFQKTLQSFCTELRLTFPELSAAIDRAAATTTPAAYLQSWATVSGVRILLQRNTENLMTEKRGFLVGAVCLTADLWKELSPATQIVIWRYLRMLLLEAVMECDITGLDAAVSQDIIQIVQEEQTTGGPAATTGSTDSTDPEQFMKDLPARMEPFLQRLKSAMGGFGMDLSGMADIPIPEIPTHLLNGKIMSLVKDLMKHIKPEEFGIDPELFKSNDTEFVLRSLAELYQRNPQVLTDGAKRVAERIKTRIMGGSINRDEIIAEAREFMNLFKEHPMFKEIVGKLDSVFGENGVMSMMSGGGGAPDPRLSAVQQRLRAKLAARQKK